MKKTVMIVDDAAFMRMSLRMMLEKHDFEVIAEAEDGEQAVRKYGENTPDIVTMDITMPVMDGISALKQIKTTYPQSNVVMISAMGQEAMVIEAVKSGAKGFIVKPFTEDKVITALSKL